VQSSNAHPWSRDPTPGIAVVIAGIALVGFLLMTAAVLFFPAFQTLDARITSVMREASAPGSDALARSLTFLGDTWVMVALTVLGATWLLARGRRAEAVLLTATMIIGTAAGALLKELVERARPGLEMARIPVPDSYSFPSGHALAAFLYFGIVAFLFFIMARSARLKLWGWFVCSALAFGVALSRVYLGVHYLGDIIASWMLGSAFLLVAVLVYVWWVTREQASEGVTPGGA
jgi:undecaprenyl-diphosphatase